MSLIASPLLKQAAVTRRLPKLPVAVKHGVGVSVGSRIFVGLGSGGRAWMCLDLADRRSSWRSLKEFPGLPRDQALAMAVGAEVYVFGGAGYDPQEKRYRTFQDIHRYDTRTDTWTAFVSTSPAPLLGAAISRRADGAAVFFGGVHNAVFNGFFRASAAATGDQLDTIVRKYLSMEAARYRFSSTVHVYEPTLDRWSTLGDRPGIPCVGSALAQRGEDVYLLGGEIKPGLRSTQVFRVRTSDAGLFCDRLEDLPADLLNGSTDDASAETPAENPAAEPEGMAGAMAIFSGDSLVLAGGTSFPGAKARYLQGQTYAHEDLPKHWRREILVLEKTVWRVVGKLPCGLAHAQIFSWDDELVIVGGESEGGEARTDVLTLAWEEP
jgi:N-acetylneuraminate epimerase